jgi:hypothetical protein
MREDSMFKSLVIRSLVLAIGLFFTVAARAATITVTSNGDTIAVNANVTLREALSSINNGANVNADVVPVGAYGTNDTINFNITPAGFFLINILGSSLPTIVKPITIDGSTQGGSVQNTAVTGDNSTHNIMLNCSSVNSCTDGLTLGQGSAGSTIRFLIFDSAPGSGLVVNSANNIIAGNWVGLDSAGGGTPSAGNGTGINVFSAGPPQDVSGNVIGGMNPQDRNVIANNTAQQLALARLLVGGLYGGGSNIVVQNNYVGTDKAGTTGLLNGGGGIRMTDLLNATIGGASNSLGVSCVAPCNLIAGNSQQPLSTNTNTNSTNNTGYLIQGNFFGTNVTGTAGVTGGNGASAQAVIELAGAGTVMIGGTAAGTGNLISGFSTARPGILVDTGVVGPVTIQGNFIGTTTTGNAALGNGGPGIDILGATNVTIGGTLPAARNVIGGNGNGMSPKGPGILVEGNPPFSTGTAVIQGNNIGIGANGSSNIGNIGDGIDFASGATGSTVGASSSGGAGANIIAFNGAGRTNGAGVGVPNGSATNKIFSNSIFSNTGSSTGIGIDLSAGGSATDGPTANDACDGDAGGNNLQNFPVLTSAQSTGSSITIAGILNSTASTTFTIEFFSNPAGTSQGRTFLGSTSTTTNGACSGAFNAVLAQTVSAGLNITAAATDPSGNTSEFSAAVASTATLTAANATVTGRISDNFGNAIAGVSIRLNGTQTRLTITDGNGNYGFDGVETNGIYAVTPSRANYLFNPANRSFSSLGAHTEASFTGTTNGDHANAIDTNEFFVRQQYLDFLGREPDPPGFNGWMNTLTNCAAGDTSCDRVHVSEMFYRSAEFQERGYFAYRFYATALGRKPDYLEFTPDLQRVGGFLTQDQLTAAKNLLALDFVARPEFVSRYGSLSNPAYVDQLLNTAGVTLANRQSLIDSLTNGTATRAQVLQEISESGDVYRKFYNQAFVVMEYFGYLHRDPDELYTNWIAELDRTGNPRQMVEGFVNSVEYRNRFVP